MEIYSFICTGNTVDQSIHAASFDRNHWINAERRCVEAGLCADKSISGEKYIVEARESVIKYVKDTQADEGYHKIIEIIDNIVIKYFFTGV